MSITYPTYSVSLALSWVLNIIWRYSKNIIVFKIDSKNFDRQVKSMNLFVKKIFMNIEKITGVTVKQFLYSNDELSFQFKKDDYRVSLNRKDSEVYLYNYLK
jgi:hypothetical protein